MARLVGGYQIDQRLAPRFRIVVSEEATTFRSSSNARNALLGLDDAVPITVYSGANRSRFGIHARGAFIQHVSEVPGQQLEGTKIFVPIFSIARYRNLTLGEVVTYSDRPAIILGLRNEATRS